MKLMYSSLVALLAPLLLVLSCMMERWGIRDSKVTPYITLSPPQYMTTHYEESQKRQLMMILPPVLFLLIFMHHYYLLLGWDPVLTDLPAQHMLNFISVHSLLRSLTVHDRWMCFIDLPQWHCLVCSLSSLSRCLRFAWQAPKPQSLSGFIRYNVPTRVLSC